MKIFFTVDGIIFKLKFIKVIIDITSIMFNIKDTYSQEYTNLIKKNKRFIRIDVVIVQTQNFLFARMLFVTDCILSLLLLAKSMYNFIKHLIIFLPS